jgi:DNA-binding winged helix-turn-helix (wHTH) protein/Tol biopolymer transport system component
MSARRLRFGAFEFDAEAGQLTREGRTVRIQPQPLRVLAILLEEPGRVVPRDELRLRIWGGSTFVEFDLGLNYCVRQIRLALHDTASRPLYIETLKKRGYRFVAPVSSPGDMAARPAESAAPQAVPPSNAVPPNSRIGWNLPAVTFVAMVMIAGWQAWPWPHAGQAVVPPGRVIAQITDLADSAVSPALSPDGRILAFIRGCCGFLTADDIYVKILPNGEPRRLTHDLRLKYGPTFSSDGSEVSYTVQEHSGWSTYAVSVLGGEPHLVLSNAAGLRWLSAHQVLFAEIKAGQHMGVVTASDSRANKRELYFPAHERGMAHYIDPSPDHQSALVVEMNAQGAWLPCRLISLQGDRPSRPVGPPGAACGSAGWSPDGRWMYVAAGQHLWRQSYPDGAAEPITSGPSTEEGLAVDPDGRSLITSSGTGMTTLWMHQRGVERRLSAEGDLLGAEGSIAAPRFSADGRFVYYLARRAAGTNRGELRRVSVESGQTAVLLPEIGMREYDVSADGSRVLFTTSEPGGTTQLWLAPIDKSAAPVRIGLTGETSPYFGSGDQILFRTTEGRFNYLERMHADGSGRARVVPYPISDLQSVSPGRRWAMVIAPIRDGSTVAPMAVPLTGGDPIRICEDYCDLSWSIDGAYLFASVDGPSASSPGRSLAIPVGAHEALPRFPPLGIPSHAEPAVVPGARSVPAAFLTAGVGPDTFAFIKAGTHRNLFRIAVP